MLEQTGDFNVEASFGINGLDFQGAVSPVKNLGLSLGYCYYHTSDSRSLFSAALGYYHRIGTKGLFEIYGGYGAGTYTVLVADSTGTGVKTKGDFSRIFIQPAMGITVTKETVPDRNMRGNSYLAVRFLNMTYGGQGPVLFVEPVLGGRMGWDRFQFNSQMGFSFPVSGTGFDNFPFIWSLGLTYGLRKANRI